MEEMVLVLRYAAPVAYASLGETVGQRAGLINIGLDGTMLFGAYFGMLVSLQTGSPGLGMLAGLGVGLVAGLFLGWFAVILAADQVVVGTAANLLALGLTGTLFRARFGESGQLLSVPSLPKGAYGEDLVLVALPVVTLLVWFLLMRTRVGLALRAVGEYPKAVDAAGLSVKRLRLGASAFGGALGGLAGAYLALGIAGSFTENMTGGRGFVAIAMVTFGRWSPPFVFLAAVLIGLAESLGYWLQARGLGVPHQLLLALPYVLALAVLVAVGRGRNAPEALTRPYDPAGR